MSLSSSKSTIRNSTLDRSKHPLLTPIPSSLTQETQLDPLPSSFTFRAVFVGISIGILLAFTNMYFGLQTGWISMMPLQSSILGYAVFKLSSNFDWAPLTIAENVVLQTTSTAVCAMPLTAGLIGIIPALAQLDLKTDGLLPITFSPITLMTWCFAISFFGIFVAIPLREQVIIKEKLVFPSGTATAQILALLHQKPIIATTPSASSSHHLDHPAETSHRFQSKHWKLLIYTFSTSVSFSMISIAFPVLYALPIFDIVGPLAHDWSWWFTPSFAFVGQGIIMGLHTTYSMLLGMLFGWMFLSPMAVAQGWATTETVKAWIIWPALSIMIVESMFSLLEFLISVVNTNSGKFLYSPVATEEDQVQEPREKQRTMFISFRFVLIGILTSGLVCVILIGILFEDIKWWATVVALVLASIFSLLGVRALGQTDLNPVSSIAKISQLIFAVLQPQNLVANLVAGGISEAGAMQSGELMQDFKTAYLHGVDPASMLYAQTIGSFVSVFVSSGAYILYSKAYTLPSATLPVPTSAVWLSLARLLNNGKLPEGSKMMMVISGSLFFILGIVKMSFKEDWIFSRFRIISKLKHHPCSWFIPSGIAFSMGMINIPSFSITRFLGGLIAYKVEQKGRKRNKDLRRRSDLSTRIETNQDQTKEDQIWLIIVATGFVLGEGFGSIFNLFLRTVFHFKPLSCWGCNLGGGGYCTDC